MKSTIKWSSIALAVAMGNGLVATQAVAEGEGFIEGASATLSNRTVYFNRDFRSNPGKREETATGFLLNFQSGFSEGPIGLGADVVAMSGIKLDTGRGRNGTGLLAVDNDGSTPNEYSQIRGAVKAHVLNDTVLRYGIHFVDNPVIAYDDARLLPSHYSGYSITNKSIEGLFVEAGRMNKRSEMNDSSEPRGAFIEREKVVYLGGSYDFNDNLNASLYTSKADDLWKRHFAGLGYSTDLGNGLTLGTDLAYYHTSDDSPAGENFANKGASLGLNLGAGHHGFSYAYQRMSGKHGFEYFDGGIYLANSVQYLDFNARKERSHQVRYDYDFEGMGIPGLSFMTRYIRGSNIDRAYEGIDRDTRWERNTELQYTFQAGALEGLNVRWRNATVRQDSGLDGGDVDENRLIVSYTWTLL